MVHRILVQSGMVVMSTRPRNTGIKANTKIVETKKSRAAWGVIIQSSLNLFQSPEGPIFFNVI
jgi:hypothetical protein